MNKAEWGQWHPGDPSHPDICTQETVESSQWHRHAAGLCLQMYQKLRKSPRQQGWGSKHEQKNSGLRFSSVQIIHGMLSAHVPGLMRDKRQGENTSHHSVISSNRTVLRTGQKQRQAAIFWTIRIQKRANNMKTCSISSLAWRWQRDCDYPFSQLDIWLI